jgi:hypothetical protein
MCLNCDCGKPDDNHGDARNITLQDIDQAALAAGTTRARAFENIIHGIQRQASADNVHLSQSVTPQTVGLEAYAYSQSQAQNNRDAQSQAQPGTYAPPIGHDSGSAYGRDQQMINYRPPENQEHIS